jgi:hypothetical protein
LVRRVYQSILARPPTAAEAEQAIVYLLGRGKEFRAAACGESVWALLTSAEFRFNH